jgi:hypothetical protein
MELRSKNLAKPDPGCSCLGTAKGSTDIKCAELACSNGHSRTLVRSPPRALKNLRQLWIAVDNRGESIKQRYRTIGGKRPPGRAVELTSAHDWWETYAADRQSRRPVDKLRSVTSYPAS